jgi:hypothetical protein
VIWNGRFPSSVDVAGVPKMSKDVTDDDDDVVVVVVENLVIKDNDDDDDGLVLNCLARVDARDLRLL